MLKGVVSCYYIGYEFFSPNGFADCRVEKDHNVATGGGRALAKNGARRSHILDLLPTDSLQFTAVTKVQSADTTVP